jgi:aspartate-semialdehyde dehydrogenase
VTRIGVIGATGAVGTVALELLAKRGFDNVRAFASARSEGKTVRYGDRNLVVEEATPDALDDLDLCFFSVGTAASRELVPHAVRGGAVCIDKSDAYRLADGVPLVVAGVNDEVLDQIELPPPHPVIPGTGIIANPNCSAIQLSLVLKPLQDSAGLVRVHLATYQSASGAGDPGIERLRDTTPDTTDLTMDWELEGDEYSEEAKIRAETRKILALPELPLQANCVRVPVMVGHAQAVWVETREPLAPEHAQEVLAAAPHVQLAEAPTPKDAAGADDVLVGRIRQDPTVERGLLLWSVCDNLRKGAALNAVQIAELLLARRLLAA